MINYDNPKQIFKLTLVNINTTVILKLNLIMFKLNVYYPPQTIYYYQQPHKYIIKYHH